MANVPTEVISVCSAMTQMDKHSPWAVFAFCFDGELRGFLTFLFCEMISEVDLLTCLLACLFDFCGRSEGVPPGRNVAGGWQRKGHCECCGLKFDCLNTVSSCADIFFSRSPFSSPSGSFCLTFNLFCSSSCHFMFSFFYCFLPPVNVDFFIFGCFGVVSVQSSRNWFLSHLASSSACSCFLFCDTSA